MAAAPGARGLRTNAADIEARNNALKLLRDELQNLINMLKNLIEIRSNLTKDIEKRTLKSKAQSHVTMETMASLCIVLTQLFAKEQPNICGIVHDITYQLSEKIVEPTASANAVAAQTGRGAGGGSKADNSSRDELQAQRNKTHELQAQYNKLQEASAAVVSGLKEYHRVFNKPGGEKPPCVLHMDRNGECRTHGMVDCNLLATLAKLLNNRSKYGGKSSDGRGGGLGGGRDSGRSSGNASDKDSTRGGRSGGAGGGSRKALTNGANGTSTEELEHLEEEDNY